MARIILAAIVVWIAWAFYQRWQRRKRLRDFEEAQRRKWEGHRLEK